MRFSIVSALLSATTMVTATINLGSVDGGDSIAWLGGSDPCTYDRISAAGTNPCGKKFTLKNGFTYYVCQRYQF
jgi:hypothetical protein